MGSADKRDALRVPCDLPIRMYGTSREIDGRMLNISRTGIRIRLPLSGLLVPSRSSFADVVHAVEHVLGSPFRADLHHEMLGPLIRRHLSTLRVTTVDADADEIELGCRFEEALTDDETVMLGIGLPPVGVTVAAAFKQVPPPKRRGDPEDDQPHQPRPDDYESILHPSDGLTSSPLVGTTEGAQGADVLLAIPARQVAGLGDGRSTSPLDAVKRAFGSSPRLEILDGLLMVWAGPVELQEIELPGNESGHALLLVKTA